jgi:hypothetical protein
METKNSVLRVCAKGYNVYHRLNVRKGGEEVFVSKWSKLSTQSIFVDATATEDLIETSYNTNYRHFTCSNEEFILSQLPLDIVGVEKKETAVVAVIVTAEKEKLVVLSKTEKTVSSIIEKLGIRQLYVVMLDTCVTEAARSLQAHEALVVTAEDELVVSNKSCFSENCGYRVKIAGVDYVTGYITEGRLALLTQSSAFVENANYFTFPAASKVIKNAPLF